MENISLFLNACKNFGVSQISCFQTVDLYENKQPYKVKFQGKHIHNLGKH